MPSRFLGHRLSPGARFFLWIIHGYQRCVSPFMAPRCRFYPTCSEYAKEALFLHPPVFAFKLILIRLLKCHPFHPGGCDWVPPASKLPTNQQ